VFPASACAFKTLSETAPSPDFELESDNLRQEFASANTERNGEFSEHIFWFATYRREINKTLFLKLQTIRRDIVDIFLTLQLPAGPGP
jgi:hypothetical protein